MFEIEPSSSGKFQVTQQKILKCLFLLLEIIVCAASLQFYCRFGLSSICEQEGSCSYRYFAFIQHISVFFFLVFLLLFFIFISKKII